MNINQYRCNMKVLTGLFLANDIELDNLVNSVVGKFVDLFDDKNPLIQIYLYIPIYDRSVDLNYFFREPKYHIETSLYFDSKRRSELKVFLL